VERLLSAHQELAKFERAQLGMSDISLDSTKIFSVLQKSWKTLQSADSSSQPPFPYPLPIHTKTH
jgi:hypothetical protein